MAAFLASTACSRYFPLNLEPVVVKNYVPGVERRAAIGEPIFRVQQAREIPTFVAQRQISIRGVGKPLMRGTRFVAVETDRKGRLRLRSADFSANGGSILASPAGRDLVFVDQTGIATRLPAAVGDSLFRKVTEMGDQPGAFTAELIYSGIAGNIVRAVYREYIDDLARPAFSQELQYDLSADRSIAYKSLRIQVIEATNGEIRYRVTDDGGLPWLPAPRPMLWLLPTASAR